MTSHNVDIESGCRLYRLNSGCSYGSAKKVLPDPKATRRQMFYGSTGGEELRRLGFCAEWLRYVSQEMGSHRDAANSVPGRN